MVNWRARTSNPVGNPFLLTTCSFIPLQGELPRAVLPGGTSPDSKLTSANTQPKHVRWLAGKSMQKGARFPLRPQAAAMGELMIPVIPMADSLPDAQRP